VSIISLGEVGGADELGITTVGQVEGCGKEHPHGASDLDVL